MGVMKNVIPLKNGIQLSMILLDSGLRRNDNGDIMNFSKLTTIVALVVAVLCATPSVSFAGEKHPFGFEDMMKVYRISGAQVSPDGKWVVYSAGLPNFEKNKVEKGLWLVSTDGGAPRRLTKDGVTSYGAVWAPGGKHIIYVAVKNGSAQAWQMDPFTVTEKQLTKFPVDVDNVGISPDGRWLTFSANIYPDCGDLQCTVDKDKEETSKKAKAYTYDELLFRHWDTWSNGKRNHFFVMPIAGGAPVDLTMGMNSDTPSAPWGGPEEIAVSPDGSEAAFVAKTDPNPAVHTNSNIYVTKIDGSDRKCITADNKAYDTAPTYSPDGKYIAYLAMKRPGYESDRMRIALYNRATGKTRMLTEKWDRSPQQILWGGDGKTIFATAENMGNLSIFAVDVATGTVKTIVEKHYNGGMSIASGELVFARDSFTSPAEIFKVGLDGKGLAQVTSMNKQVLENVTFSEPEEFWFKGAKGELVHGFFFKPADFQEGKTYPFAYFIHGGPQNSFMDHFHYRWNLEIAAGEGFAAAAVNFHGSTGYGEKFTMSISRDWGGKPYVDIMKGLDFLLEKYPWIDAKRACALGASYGGYMVNWIEGHTDRFACLVNHDGIFSNLASYYNTEELWFSEWEMNGTPYDNPSGYEKWSPDRFVKNWKTPMLVIHGGKDYRVVDTEGISTFTALRRKGIPARFVYFPDENHWVLKPNNTRLWHKEVYDWIKKWTSTGTPN
jgi:dipeptidyl aminopeptidase/acylaminoacyl peptidase